MWAILFEAMTASYEATGIVVRDGDTRLLGTRSDLLLLEDLCDAIAFIDTLDQTRTLDADLLCAVNGRMTRSASMYPGRIRVVPTVKMCSYARLLAYLFRELLIWYVSKMHRAKATVPPTHCPPILTPTATSVQTLAVLPSLSLPSGMPDDGLARHLPRHVMPVSRYT